MINRRYASLGLVGASLLAQPSWGSEPDFPNRPVRLIVPFEAGGGVDALARNLAIELADIWKQPVIVDNKPGADTIIGTGEAVRSKPDGYTLLANITAIVQTPHLRSKMPYDTLEDLTPVVRVSSEGLFFVVLKSLDVSTAAKFIETARRRPNEISFGSWGNGSTSHLLLASLQSKAQVSITHVPFKGVSSVLQALLSGSIDSGMLPYVVARAALESGKITMIGLAGSKRSQVLPQVPTLEEQGLPGFTREQWLGLFAPARTPASIVEKIAADATLAINRPRFSAWLRSIGGDPAGGKSQAFAATVRQDSDYYRDVINAAHLRIE